MMYAMDPLREEHQEMLPHVEAILRAALRVGEVPLSDLRPTIEEVYDFLEYHLKPHAEAEEAGLYPAVQKVMGSPDATRTMIRDHVEIRHYTDDLKIAIRAIGTNTLSHHQMGELRRILFGVYALVHVHFFKEEEVYLPLLDNHLSQDEARLMFESMEKTAQLSRHIHTL